MLPNQRTCIVVHCLSSLIWAIIFFNYRDDVHAWFEQFVSHILSLNQLLSVIKSVIIDLNSVIIMADRLVGKGHFCGFGLSRPPCLLWFSGLIILLCYFTLLPSKIQTVQADIEHSEFIQSLSSSAPHSSQPPAIHVWFLNPALFICQMLCMGREVRRGDFDWCGGWCLARGLGCILLVHKEYI